MREPNKKKYYLCAICGLFIRSSITHLVRHEKLHAEKVSRVKCLATECDKTFHNKDNYWLHWKRTHGEVTMPDKIVYVSETPKLRGKIQHKSTQCSKSNDTEPIDFFVLNKMNLVQKNGLKLKSVVSFCLEREPMD